MRQFFLIFIWYSVVASFPPLLFGQATIRIVDDDNKPVTRFEVMIHTADHGYESWRGGGSGSFRFASRGYFESTSIDVLVRAAGYASLLRSYAGPAKDGLMRSGTTIVLQRGREVQLKLKLPTGMEPPGGLLPIVYFPELAWRVEASWQPQNIRGKLPDFNMLGVGADVDNPGQYVFRLPHEPREFIVAIHQAGWLRFFKAGPFSNENFIDNTLVLEIPRPATLASRFEPGDQSEADLPFSGLHWHLMRQQYEGGSTYLSVASEARKLADTSLHVSDVAPGKYMLQLFTEPKTPDVIAGTEINRGRFFARKEMELRPAEVVRETLSYVPFDLGAKRGDRTAHIRVFGADGLPAAGKQLKVEWFDGHYGSIPIYDGTIPANGIVLLEGVSDKVPTEGTRYRLIWRRR